MKSSMLSIVILLLLGVTAFGSNAKSCHLKFFKHPADHDIYFHDGTSNIDDALHAWSSIDPPLPGQQYIFSSFRAVEVQSCADTCELTIYSTATFGGKTQTYVPQNMNEIVFPWCIKSYTIDCGAYEEEEEEEGEYTLE